MKMLAIVLGGGIALWIWLDGGQWHPESPCLGAMVDPARFGFDVTMAAFFTAMVRRQSADRWLLGSRVDRGRDRAGKRPGRSLGLGDHSGPPSPQVARRSSGSPRMSIYLVILLLAGVTVATRFAGRLS